MVAAYEPTEERRRLVSALSGFGVPQEDIATHIGIDAKTLRKHYREELDRGMVEANAKVAQSLFRMATQGNNVAAAIFWMKARAGWREKQTVEHSVAPSPLSVITGVPREHPTNEEWAAHFAEQNLPNRTLDLERE